MGQVLFVVVIGVFCLLLWFWHRANVRNEAEERTRQEEERRQKRGALIAKYGSEEIADSIIAQRIWQGMTIEQLKESWGDPQDIDQKIYKRKTKETWKYGRIGKNRFSQKVFTEDGVVVGWQQ